MRLFDALYYYVVAPEEGMQKLKILPKPVLGSMFVVLIALFSHIIANTILNPVGSSYIAISVTFGLMLQFLIYLFAWLSFSAILHFISGLYRGDGKARDLFVLFGFSLLPFVLLPAGALIARSLGVFLYVLLYLCVLFLLLRFNILALKHVYRFSTNRAFIIWIMPFVFGFILLFAISSVGIIAIVMAIVSSMA